MNNKGIGSAVHLAHLIIAEVLPDGGTAIDATAGNGHDTLFLARRVGPAGRVYAFDVQERALYATKKLLTAHDACRQVTLFKHGHEDIGKLVPPPVDAVIFNLGYLPGGEHKLITKPVTTIAALEAAAVLLRPGGRIGLVVYTGHSGAAEELSAVEEFVSLLDPAVFNVVRTEYLNRTSRAPVMIFVEKAGGFCEE